MKSYVSAFKKSLTAENVQVYVVATSLIDDKNDKKDISFDKVKQFYPSGSTLSRKDDSKPPIILATREASLDKSPFIPTSSSNISETSALGLLKDYVELGDYEFARRNIKKYLSTTGSLEHTVSITRCKRKPKTIYFAH
jgi:hypothetical protein